MPIIPDTPGGRLNALRKASGLSSAQVAARLGCATSAVSNHENSINGIRADVAAAYADLFGSSPQWILYGDGAPPLAPRPPPKAGVNMTSLGGGKVRLEMSTVLPFSVAVQILALVQGDEK